MFVTSLEQFIWAVKDQNKFGNRILFFNMLLKTVSKWMSCYKWPLYNLFWSFFCLMYVQLPQNWGSDGHFEVLNRFKSFDTKCKYFHIFSFVILYKNRSLDLLHFLRFYVFCHSFCTNKDLDLTSKVGKTMAKYGLKMASHQLLIIGSSPSLHGASDYIWCHNFWPNQDLDPLSTSKWPSESQFCER